LDVVGHLGEDRREPPVAVVAADRAQRPDQRQPHAQHGRELAREQGHRDRLDGLPPALEGGNEALGDGAARLFHRRRARLDQDREQLGGLEDAEDLVLGGRDLDPLVRVAALVPGSVVVAGHQMWSARVAARTSSTVVWPSRTFLIPLFLNVISPSDIALSLIWSSFSPSSTMRRM